jgi:hypothetical protein
MFHPYSLCICSIPAAAPDLDVYVETDTDNDNNTKDGDGQTANSSRIAIASAADSAAGERELERVKRAGVPLSILRLAARIVIRGQAIAHAARPAGQAIVRASRRAAAELVRAARRAGNAVRAGARRGGQTLRRGGSQLRERGRGLAETSGGRWVAGTARNVGAGLRRFHSGQSTARGVWYGIITEQSFDLIEHAISPSVAREAAREASRILLERGYGRHGEGEKKRLLLLREAAQEAPAKPRYIPLKDYEQLEYGERCILLTPPGNASEDEIRPALELGPANEEQLAELGFVFSPHPKWPQVIVACNVTGEERLQRIKEGREGRWEEEWETIVENDEWEEVEEEWKTAMAAMEAKWASMEREKKEESELERIRLEQLLLKERKRGRVIALERERRMRRVEAAAAALGSVLLVIALALAVFLLARVRLANRDRARTLQAAAGRWDRLRSTPTPAPTGEVEGGVGNGEGEGEVETVPLGA